MGRVSKNTLEKLNAFFDTLPDEARRKCTLCNETLTHIVKQAEAQTGAGTATVCRMVAQRVNDEAVENEKVNDKQLRQRVIRAEGGNEKCTNRTDSKGGAPAKTEPQLQHSDAAYFVALAIGNLERIMDDDPGIVGGLAEVVEWCHARLNQLEEKYENK